MGDAAEVELVATALSESTRCVHRDDWSQEARAVVAALDLPARDAKVRADAWRDALSIVEQATPEASNPTFRRGLEAYQLALTTGLKIAERLARKPRPAITDQP